MCARTHRKWWSYRRSQLQNVLRSLVPLVGVYRGDMATERAAKKEGQGPGQGQVSDVPETGEGLEGRLKDEKNNDGRESNDSGLASAGAGGGDTQKEKEEGEEEENNLILLILVRMLKFNESIMYFAFAEDTLMGLAVGIMKVGARKKYMQTYMHTSTYTSTHLPIVHLRTYKQTNKRTYIHTFIDNSPCVQNAW